MPAGRGARAGIRDLGTASPVTEAVDERVAGDRGAEVLGGGHIFCAAASTAIAPSVHGPVVMTRACSRPSAASAAQRSANRSADSPGFKRVLTVFSISS